jgi:hypothetical protein
VTRAFLLGALFSLVIGFISPYTVMSIQPMGMSADFITAGAIFCLLLIVGILNTALKLFRKPFKREELILIYSMMIVASAVPCWGFMLNLIPIISGLYYFATPENEWAELIHPYIRSFLAPQDRRAITAFFEGAFSTFPMPWKPWIVPFISWFIFMMALYLVMICAVVIMRRQWVEHERLTFPLTILPLEMTREGFFKGRLMWVGFFIPFFILSLNALHNYFPIVPQLNLWKWFNLYRGSTYLIVNLSFSILGFSYLVNLDVSLSLWLFHLLSRLETVLFSVFDYYIPGGTPVQCGSSPMTTHQGMGAMIALVFWAFWMARRHLANVLSSVLRGGRDGEAFSFRAAFLGIILGLPFLGFWLWASGIPALVVPLFLFGAFIVFIGLTRIVAEGGVGFCRAQCIPQPFVVFGIGSRSLGPQGLVSLGLTYTWVSDVRTIVMTSVLHGFKMADPVKLDRRKIVYGAWIAVFLSFVISYFTIIRTGYAIGALNAQKRWFFHSLPVVVAREITSKLQQPVEKDAIVPRWMFTGLGVGFMAFLMFMRYRFLWFPVHYLGFPINDTWIMANAWFSIFLGWLIKLAILRWGGLKAYRNIRPLFLGFILGSITCAGMWLIIDAITGMKGNVVPIGVY